MTKYIDDQSLVELTEIQDLLAEAYRHYMEFGDGGWKSNEGSISLIFPEFFWEEGWYGEGDTLPKRPGVSIYSYVLGPSRSHYFNNTTQALAAVRKWHANEMGGDAA